MYIDIYFVDDVRFISIVVYRALPSSQTSYVTGCFLSHVARYSRPAKSQAIFPPGEVPDA
jgi:hypothetical protein